MHSVDIFAALANPTRRGILDLLRKREHSAGAIGSVFPDLPQPSVSRHLRVLREAGLVRVRRRAQQRLYALAPERLQEVDAWVATYREFWSHRLDALSRRLEQQGPGRRRHPEASR